VRPPHLPTPADRHQRKSNIQEYSSSSSPSHGKPGVEPSQSSATGGGRLQWRAARSMPSYRTIDATNHNTPEDFQWILKVTSCHGRPRQLCDMFFFRDVDHSPLWLAAHSGRYSILSAIQHAVLAYHHRIHLITGARWKCYLFCTTLGRDTRLWLLLCNAGLN
jgi:hypothetical protein